MNRLRLGSALRACQLASERCGRALPEVSPADDVLVQSLSDCLEMSELCAQALGRALEGIHSPFLEDELTLCGKVATACAEALQDVAGLEACAKACRDCAAWCQRVLDASAEQGSRSAA